uniref:FIIND domain-containing protein n=1 Tax=Varanus komodoensis TaxID=61221 RepID=A0A8D2Q7P6_VARKO
IFLAVFIFLIFLLIRFLVFYCIVFMYFCKPPGEICLSEKQMLVVFLSSLCVSCRMQCPRAGNFECSVTKLKFEMRSGGTLTYMYSSWDQHLGKAEMQDWMAAGPLFNIQADASGKVATIHLPLFICLKGRKTDISQIKIAHFLDVGMTVEEPTRMSPFHVVLENPTFSFLGVLCKSMYRLFHFFPIHSVVQLYQSSRTASLHLYVIPNDSSLIQAIKDEEEKHHSMLVQKRPQTDEPLYFGSHYVVRSSTDLKINPEELEFSYQNPGQLQSFVEICVGKEGRIELSLRKKENLCSVWDAWLEPGIYSQMEYFLLADTRQLCKEELKSF